MSFTGQLVAQDLVDHLRIGFAPGCLHNLPDQKTKDLFLAGAVLHNLLGTIIDHLVYRAFDFISISNLLKVSRRNDFTGISLAIPHAVKDLFRNFPRDAVVVNLGDQIAQH